MNFEKQMNTYINMVNDEINRVFSVPDNLQKHVYEAMRYSIAAGGKRIRPILTLAACDILGGDMAAALHFGIALECIHTYSLIHDDLPCMDDDDMRRGNPTCHKVFGEANALLAGDGLLTFAFEYLSEAKDIKPEIAIKLISSLSKAAGCDGMIGGQVVDLENEGKTNINEETLTYMHERKTGALISCAVSGGGICADATDEEMCALEKFAKGIGLAFQIQDDILDCIGTEEALGKPIGSDNEKDKTTYVKLLGIEAAKERAESLTNDSIAALEVFGSKAEFLISIARMLMGRKN